MRKFLLGFVAGAATYHLVLGPPNEELISDLRSAIQRIDDRLAETEKGTESEKPPEPVAAPEDPGKPGT